MDDNKEVWMPIPGLDYSISSYGRVKSHSRKIKRKNYGEYYNKEMILSLAKHTHGYLTVSLYKDGKGFKKYVHRLVAEAFIPKIVGKNQVNHISGIKTDNRIENLEWVDNSENQIHAHLTGLKKGYDKHGMANPKYKNGKYVLVNQTKTCEECGTDFTAKYAHNRFCSKKCTGRHSVRIISKHKAELQASGWGNR